MDLEVRISPKIIQERIDLEQEFSNTEVSKALFPNRDRILELALEGEIGISRKLISEQIRRNHREEEMLETLSLVETYEKPDMLIFESAEDLISRFPENRIGNSLISAGNSYLGRDWEGAIQHSSTILREDVANPFALLVSAKSYSYLGNWDLSSIFWDRLSRARLLNSEELFEFARTSYNGRKFSLVLRINEDISKRGESVSEKILELCVRSHYNLRDDDSCIIWSRKLLDLEPGNKIGLRHLSRSLFRLGRLLEAIPIMEELCRIQPSSVDYWESLIETQLMMDDVLGAKESRRLVRELVEKSPDLIMMAIELSMKFHWREEYESLIESSKSRKAERSFTEEVANINFRLGDLGSAWEILSSADIDPMESSLGDEIRRILEITNTDPSEIKEMLELDDSIWVTQLVSREFIRKSAKKRKVRKGKKKCLLISSSLDRGGAERQVAMTLKHMQKSKEFDCFLSVHRMQSRKGQTNYLDDLRGLKNRVYDLDEIDTKRKDAAGYDIIDESSEILDLLESNIRIKVCQLILHFSEHRPDIVHAWQDETILTSCLAASLTGVPVVLGSARSMRPDKKTELHLRKRPYLRNCFRVIFSSGEYQLSTNSNAGKESYADWIGLDSEKILLNENGVDFNEIQSRMESKSVLEEIRSFGFSKENKIIGGLFRLEAGKRPELWIEAFENARRVDSSIRGIIVGGGRMEKTVRSWVENSKLDEFIKIVGETRDVGSWLQSMDVFLFTSITEGMPNVLIEAQGFGVPVVSTLVGGVPEVVINGETGILVDSSSAEELGVAIVDLLSRQNLEEIGRNSRKISRQRFSVARMAKKTGEMYSRVLSAQIDRGVRR